ncbi:MAG: hypothetical protein EOP59_03150 [Sphingomonadales bacterium]|nr:MAG: hypothetical protein EOP59_03150 [Sphingomonadales bacterium]
MSVRYWAALLVVVGAHPWAAQAQTPSGPVATYLDSNRILAFDTRCKVLGVLEREGLTATMRDAQAQIPAAALVTADAEAKSVSAQMNAADCASPQARGFAPQVKAVGYDQGAMWLARLDAVARISSTEAWAAGRTLAGDSAGKIAAIMAHLSASNPAVFAAMKPRAAQEARNALAGLCAAAPSPGNPCPPTSFKPDQAAYVQKWIYTVDGFGVAVLAEQAKVDRAAAPALPPGASGWASVYAVRPPLNDFEAGAGLGSTFAVPCMRGETVVVLVGAAPVDLLNRGQAKVYALGNPALLGQIAVGRGTFTLEPRTSLALPGFAPRNALRPCQAP